MHSEPFILTNNIQHYSWGGRGREAYIPNLLGIPSDPALSYAELWMGAHPKAPSSILYQGRPVSLNEAIRMAPDEMLGPRHALQSSTSLPYLFKILSASKALSIQVHPNKQQAVRLHQKDPANYPDDNHKPEIAIALDTLTALAGFRPVSEIFWTVRNYPEFSGHLVDYQDLQTQGPDWLRRTFQQLMNTSLSSPEKLMSFIEALEKRLNSGSRDGLTPHDRLFLSLRPLHPGPDIGLLALYFLDMITLKPNQAIYLDAGIPHAYLSGNIVECMANSDNVVRAGLTSKFKDIVSLINIVRFNDAPIPVLEAKSGEVCYEYKTAAPEFRVSRIELHDKQIYSGNALDRPAILICIGGQINIKWGNSGKSISIQKGQSLFIPGSIRDFQLIAEQKSVLFLTAPNS